MKKERFLYEKRRKLIGAATGTAAVAICLPSRWTRPMIEAVLLPAHAETSPAESGTFRETSVTATVPSENNNPDFNESVDICIEVSDGNWSASVLFQGASQYYTGTGSTDGGPVALDQSSGCVEPVSLQVGEPETGGVPFEISGVYAATGVLNSGSGCPPDPQTGCN